MFESIVIKKKETSNSKIDIGFLIECLLFYKEVNLIADQFVLTDLFKTCGFESILFLLENNRLKLHIKENHIGSMQFPFENGYKYNIDVMQPQNINFDNVLYQSIQAVTKNSVNSVKITDQFLKFSKPFQYDKNLTQNIRADFNNELYLQQVFAISLNNLIDGLNLKENHIKVTLEKDSNFGPFDAYSLSTNLDFSEFTKLYQKQTGTDHEVSASAVLLDLAEFKGDLSISTAFNSALVTDRIFSSIIDANIRSLFEKLDTEQRGLGNFQNIVLNDFINIGDSIRAGERSLNDFFPIIEKADNFKNWLTKIDQDSNIINEYYKAIAEKSWIEKKGTKTLRFAFFTGASIGLEFLLQGGIGIIAGVSLNAMDTFLLDNLIRKWKPDQFIINELTSNLIKKTYSINDH